MKQLIFTAILFIMISTMSWTSAWAKNWEIDANHSTVQFGVTHIFSTVFGTFSDVEATIRFDPDHPEQGSFDFIVRVKSINTGNGKRDNHLRSKDFFDAGAYPEMRFQSSKIVHKGANNYVVTGIMTLKKTATTMEIPFVFHGIAPSPFNKKQVVAGFDTQFSLDRLAFGVGTGKFHKMGVVGKDVLVMISVEAIGDL
jgi:polyisoprenoid-binding protein YceI